MHWMKYHGVPIIIFYAITKIYVSYESFYTPRSLASRNLDPKLNEVKGELKA